MSRLESALELCAVDSVSHNEAVLASIIESRLKTNPHLEVERIGDNVVARTMGHHATRLLVAGHLDTVPGVAKNSRIEGDRLVGLGAVDMKGSLAVMVELALESSPRSVDVTWVFYAREEITRSESGLLEIGELRPDLLVADAAVLGEPTGGVVEAGCQGTLRVEIEVHGVRAHTSRPFTGRNAIHRMGELLLRVAEYEPRVVETDGVVFTEQLQAVSVSGGIAPNVVPDFATCTLNHRVAPDRDRDEALASLKDFLAPFLEEGDSVKISDFAPPAYPSLSNEHLARLVAITGGSPRGKVGWTDVATFVELGIPATNFGAGDPLYAHRADETLKLSELDEYAKALSEWLR